MGLTAQGQCAETWGSHPGIRAWRDPCWILKSREIPGLCRAAGGFLLATTGGSCSAWPACVARESLRVTVTSDKALAVTAQLGY